MPTICAVTPAPQPYTSRKRKVFFYRMTFYHLGAILLLLSALIFLRHPNWVLCDLYLGYCWMLKGIIGSFSGFLGIASVFIAMHMRTENEAVYHTWHAGKHRLYRLYLARLASIGGSRFSSFVDSDPEVRRLRGAFLRTRDTLLEQKHLTLSLLRQITSSASLAPLQREQLMNDTLVDFEKKLTDILTSFGEDR